MQRIRVSPISLTWVDAKGLGTFEKMPPGSVLALHGAVSNASSTLNFTEALNEEHNFANTLNDEKGLPNYIRLTRKAARAPTVTGRNL